MTIEHEFLASGAGVRCAHCGTQQGHHQMAAQPCVPRWGEGGALRPEPALRPAAVDAIDEIRARIIELRAEGDAARNRPADEEGGVQH